MTELHSCVNVRNAMLSHTVGWHRCLNCHEMLPRGTPKCLRCGAFPGLVHGFPVVEFPQPYERPGETDPLTAVEQYWIEGRGLIWVKRDDLFKVAGVKGGKARACWALAQGATGLTTASSRHSPQAEIVACIARELKIPCNIHVPSGAQTTELANAVEAGAGVVTHKPGYNSVITAHAKDDALATGYKYIPFGMECREAMVLTAWQTKNLPEDVKRVVVPVGGGMSLAGIVWGLVMFRQPPVPVIGIRVGADPWPRWRKWLPWLTEYPHLSLVDAGIDYSAHLPGATLGPVPLDPVYEAKCLPFLQDGDLFWAVGHRLGAHA
ncbi:MAG: pyridoxal-phosphate dependent enzyme [Dehalococcoidia bacterium]|nr:pyridoxal-phosphate dependent enzyme [Dehalococcoidia bacterium]